MSSPLRVKDVFVTPEEFLAAEKVAETRHEYLSGVVSAMAGATRTHGRITNNIIIELGGQLAGRSCFPFGPDVLLRIELSGSTYFHYPDVVVDRTASHEDEIIEPTLIFEVLSKGTERADRGDKLTNYKSLRSLCVYALVDQYRPAVTLYQRRGEREWEMEFYADLSETIDLPEIGCVLPMTQIYQGIF